MSSKATVALAIQSICTQIINNINSMQILANNLDSNGMIDDFLDTLDHIHLIGKLIDTSRKSGNIDVVTSDNKISVNAVMRHSTGFGSGTTKMVIGSVNVINFFSIVNNVESNAIFGIDYIVILDDELYPSPYILSTYLDKLSNLKQGFITMSTNLNMFIISPALSHPSLSQPNLSQVQAHALNQINQNQLQIQQSAQNVQPEQNISLPNGVIIDLQIVSNNLVLTNTMYLVGVDTTSDTVNITLPNGSARVNGRSYKIFDACGNASVNNIKILGNGARIGENKEEVIISTNYGSILLVYSSEKNKWF